MTTIAVVGIGDWGKNLLRTFDELAEVAYCCHTGSSTNAEYVQSEYPDVELTTDYDRILDDEDVDAVVVATPIQTHTEITEQAIEAGKNVFVEKPLAENGRRAKQLLTKARDRGVRLFTGYVFCYAPAIRVLKQQVEEDPVRHIGGLWTKYGSFDAPIVPSLVCHDVAVGHYLFEYPFVSTQIIEDVGIKTETDICTVRFSTEFGRELCARYDRIADEKRKELSVVTEERERYLFRDDKLYVLEADSYTDITPEKPVEPLRAECNAFLDWVQGGQEPVTGGQFGVSVNRVLDAL